MAWENRPKIIFVRALIIAKKSIFTSKLFKKRQVFMNKLDKLYFLRYGVHQFSIVKFSDYLITFSGVNDIFSWPLQYIKFPDFFRTLERRRRKKFSGINGKWMFFQELLGIGKKIMTFSGFSRLFFWFFRFFRWVDTM